MKEDIGCNGVSLHKLELGDNLRVGFPGNNIGIQIAVLPRQLLMEFGIANLGLPFYLGNSVFDGIWDVPFCLAICVLSCFRPIVSCTE